MTTATVATEVVRVGDWSRTRQVENRGNAVAMEIARINCSHCSTCSQRMDAVTSRVHRAGLNVDWERRGGGDFIVVPNPEKADPVKHLRKVLGLRLSRC